MLTKLLNSVVESYPEFLTVLAVIALAVLFAIASSELGRQHRSEQRQRYDQFMEACERAGGEGRKCQFMYLYPNYQGGAPCK